MAFAGEFGSDEFEVFVELSLSLLDSCARDDDWGLLVGLVVELVMSVVTERGGACVAGDDNSTTGDGVASTTGDGVASTVGDGVDSTSGNDVDSTTGDCVDSTTGNDVDSTIGDGVDSTTGIGGFVGGTGGGIVMGGAGSRDGAAGCGWN